MGRRQVFLEDILRIKIYFPTLYVRTKRVISITFLELKYFYSELVETSNIGKCPTKINKSYYNKCSLPELMRSRLIYYIFIKIRITYLKNWICYPSK